MKKACYLELWNLLEIKKKITYPYFIFKIIILQSFQDEMNWIVPETVYHVNII